MKQYSEMEFVTLRNSEEGFTTGPVKFTSFNMKGCVIIDGMITSRLKFGE